MLFPSTVFLFLFLPALLVLYYIPFRGSFRGKWRNAVLLLFSIAFYAWGEPLFVFLMLASTLANYMFGLILEKTSKRKLWLCIAVIFDVALLAVFKYTSFISQNIAALTGNDRLIVSIVLPIGISFFTFQMMSYIFDVYYRSSKAQHNPFYVALYITLFPQLIAGPIVRYQQVENEITERHETFADFSEGVRRFIYGLSKKVLLANYFAQIADNTFDFYKNPSVALAWLGAVAYALQIYYDFSGYSDMAIGLGRMFGFHFLENFNYPYIASSVTDFWRRWHISLSTWFRDYVYIPLGGNRVSKTRWILNLFVVWILTGIWHGANWTFLLWGLLYFCLLLVEKMTGFTKKIGCLSHVYTLLAVILCWVFFRATDVSSGIIYIGHLIGIGTTSFVSHDFIYYIENSWILLIAGIIGATPLINKAFKFFDQKKLGFLESIWLVIVFMVSVFEIVSSTYNPFIYFNF